MKKIFILFVFLLPMFVQAGSPHHPHSVLSTGKWYKISTYRAGIHKITYEDFVKMGFEPEGIDPATIRVFGNGGEILPEINRIERTDDLMENSIQVVDGGDNVFGPGDYVLFYGESPVSWKFNAPNYRFYHSKNLYSDSVYYFVNAGSEPGKRITITNPPDSIIPAYICVSFHEHACHELDSLNLIKSGKVWVGEAFSNIKDTYDFNFDLPHIDSLSAMKLALNFVGRSFERSAFIIKDNNQLYDTVLMPIQNILQQYTFATAQRQTLTVIHPHSDFRLRMIYDYPNTSSFGWLDYIEINCRRKMIFSGPQMAFRDPNTIDKNAEFRLARTNSGVHIWNVTRKNDIREIIPTSTDSTEKFIAAADTLLQEYVAFEGSGYPVGLSGPVPNQDLHAISNPDFVIVTDSAFLKASERLAAFHHDMDSMSVAVVPVHQIYNEFSSGKKDVTAIRDFVKMIYDNTGGTSPRYLALMGDGTYDPKNRIPGNNDFIPTYQSTESNTTSVSFVIDDYFALMDENEGFESNGKLDVSVGRFPVSTDKEAEVMVDKVINYTAVSDSVFGDWKNRITFVADDEDHNIHLQQAEQLTNIVKNLYPVFNIRKIYNDAYKMVQTPSGWRNPQVNEEIGKAVNEGTLILNYTGHGGEDGLAAEKIVSLQDIAGWKNKYRMPVVITATCEFTRFDNPERYTAGELLVTRPDGGAIALFSTSRLAYASVNIKLNSFFFEYLMANDSLPNPRMGDLLRLSKNKYYATNPPTDFPKNFSLFGDPALKIPFPKHRVVTTSVNLRSVSSVPDTALGLSTVNIRGEVTDTAGNKLPGYNGVVIPTVFDKPQMTSTLGNFPELSLPATFMVQNSILYKGESEVKNGEFEFSFIVPKGIILDFGKAKISYYVKNNDEDGWGYYNNLILGGEDPSVNPLNSGPVIHLYMDDLSFIAGGKTNPNTTLLATLEDPDGINFLNLGIGHDIVLTLDNDEARSVSLNDCFAYSSGSYTNGDLSYAFTGLTPGRHTLKLKAWDLYNNYSTATTSFFVRSAGDVNVKEVYNFPNPFNPGSEKTTFTITTGNISGKTSIRIDIYASNGEFVRKIEQNYSEGSPGTAEISWDGTSENGSRLSAGIYIYHVTVSSDNGNIFSTSQKLLISN